ncbi:MAG TPA: hypothetical protein VNA20_12715 [Frankiaceae bacterium]|nr:hypothetical protein [Frankiaceae bacterium]
MAVLLVVVGAALVALVVVLVAIHVTKPERFSLGVHTKWGVIGLHVEKPFYADDGLPPPLPGPPEHPPGTAAARAV